MNDAKHYAENFGGSKGYYETRLGTEWTSSEPLAVRLLRRILPVGNPGYEGKLHELGRWWVEFLDDLPWREIGLGGNGELIVAGPNERDYGFWLDTNMTLADFRDQDPTLTEIAAAEFEEAWTLFFSPAA